jgi:hypothetical protein
MTFILCLIGVSLIAGGILIAIEFVRDFHRAWREEIGRPKNRRRIHKEF